MHAKTCMQQIISKQHLFLIKNGLQTVLAASYVGIDNRDFEQILMNPISLLCEKYYAGSYTVLEKTPGENAPQRHISPALLPVFMPRYCGEFSFSLLFLSLSFHFFFPKVTPTIKVNMFCQLHHHE